ncbi:MAG: DUF2281 domain-containing protein [Snowella sp.]
MLTIETIINELDSVPEPLLAEVLDFIRSVKDKSRAFSNTSSSPRIAGLHEGQVWMSDDFNDPLPDEFWLGDDQ